MHVRIEMTPLIHLEVWMMRVGWLVGRGPRGEVGGGTAHLTLGILGPQGGLVSVVWF